jgi:hydrogenase maturation protein HypF
MKSTVAISRDHHVILSQHLGNLTHSRAFEAFRRAIDDLQQLFTHHPRWIAHDLHPAYLSTQYAHQLADQLGIPLIGVQHHHAHAAAVLAENRISTPTLSLICDGTGYGTDGSIWDGELLLASLTDFRRLARLRPIPLPGGDACSTQPWRCALSLLFAAFGPEFHKLDICTRLVDRTRLQFLREMLVNNVSCIQSSSTGRLFDGVAALLDLCRENRFDAQAPMALESAAASARPRKSFKPQFTIDQTADLVEINLLPFIRSIVQFAGRAQAPADLALQFHQTLAAAWTDAIQQAATQTDCRTVALAGGTFSNALLSQLLTQSLQDAGFRVLRHHQLPPNDGSITFGQAAVASAQIQKGLVQIGSQPCA